MENKTNVEDLAQRENNITKRGANIKFRGSHGRYVTIPLSMQTKIEWYRAPITEVLRTLKSRAGGLTSEEVAARQAEYGRNELPPPARAGALKLLLRQLQSPLVYVLLVAAGISVVVDERFDAGVILLAVILNTAVGFWQEYKADDTLHKLRTLIHQNVTVQRDGSTLYIPAAELVPGDVVIFEAGDKISADARLISSNDLEINEASLTGEAYPVAKMSTVLRRTAALGDRFNMVFAGTLVTRGKGKGVVVSTGIQTEVGHIAALVALTKEDPTPLQRQIIKLSRSLTVIVLMAAVFVGVVGIFTGQDIEQLFVTAAALAVAAIPEGLLVAMTLILVVGMKRILKRKAVVRRLLAAETLGSVSIVCSDKTGTITEGKMVVDKLLIGGELHDYAYTASPEEEKEIETEHAFALKALALCNNAYIKNPKDKLKEWEIVGDPTDAALLLAALQAGFDKETLYDEYLRVDEIAFNENRKYMATLHRQKQDGMYTFVKGAPEMVLRLCTFMQRGEKKIRIQPKDALLIRQEADELASQGLRVLAVAYRNDKKHVGSFKELFGEKEPSELVFFGWVGLKDPVRADVPRAFATMRTAGIRTVLVTGDHKLTAKSIMAELGMHIPEERICEGKTIEGLSDAELEKRIDSIDIFARVEPAHKLRIVQAWKKRGETVAMLGDGVNDAPALKAADIGVAVGTATDAAKETADLILLDNSFKVIESAIREGRVMFDNIRKVFLYLMADSFTEIVITVAALMLGYPLPLAAVHILWINLVSDGLLNLALTAEPGEKDVMSYPPRPKHESIISLDVKLIIAAVTVVSSAVCFSLFLYFLRQTGDLALARTIAFSAAAIDSVIYVFALKSLRRPIWQTNPFSNRWLILAAFTAILLQLAIVYIPLFQTWLKTSPLYWEHWLLIFLLGLLEVAVIELFKMVYWRRLPRAKTV